MKEIKAIIQPFMLEHVLEALASMKGLPGLTVSEVLGWGKTRAAEAGDPVSEAGHTFAEKRKIELVVSDELVEPVVETIRRAAHTGNVGDGKIFVVEVGQAVKIRTGERGAGAV